MTFLTLICYLFFAQLTEIAYNLQLLDFLLDFHIYKKRSSPKFKYLLQISKICRIVIEYNIHERDLS
jgi:hypothetical protein